MITPHSALILVSRTTLRPKEPGLLGEKAGFRPEAGKAQGKSGVVFFLRQKVRRCANNDRLFKGLGAVGGAANGRTWDKWSIQISNSSDGL